MSSAPHAPPRPDLRSLWLAAPDRLASRPALAGRPDGVVVDLAASDDPGAPGALAPGLRAARALASRAVLIRLSPLAAGRAEAELAAIGPERPDGVLLSGCSDGRELQHCGVKLAVWEAEQGWAAGSVGVVAAPGAAGLLALGGFPAASARLAGFALEAGAMPGDGSDAETGVVARTLLLLAAMAAGVPAYDGTVADGEWHRARRQGFAGALTRDLARLAAIAAAFEVRPGG